MDVTVAGFVFQNSGSSSMGDFASIKCIDLSLIHIYVPPGQYDEFYNIVSGGFSGQMSVYGLPSGRLFRVIPVFSVDPEKGYGYSEESKAMLNTSHGFVPWDDLHHIALSTTDGIHDGKWAFGNGNNTPRICLLYTSSADLVRIF